MFRGATRFVLALGIAVVIAHTSAADARSAHFRGVTVDALATINDIGGMADKAAPFSISPDKSQLAVVVRTADPTGNTYRQEIVIVDIGSGAAVRRAALPGEPKLQLNAEGNPIGTLETIIPQWSADGKYLYFLLAKDGVAQIMEFPVEEGSLRQTTHFASSVADFKVLPDGNHLQVRYFDAGGRAKEASTEAREGYRYDERWKPTVSNRPLPAPPKTKTTFVAIATGDPVLLTAQDNDAQSDQPRDTVSTYGRAMIEAVNPEFLNSPVRISVQ